MNNHPIMHVMAILEKKLRTTEIPEYQIVRYAYNYQPYRGKTGRSDMIRESLDDLVRGGELIIVRVGIRGGNVYATNEALQMKRTTEGRLQLLEAAVADLRREIESLRGLSLIQS